MSYGLLNLTHRDSHEHPEALEPGHDYTVDVPFKHVAQTFRAGHRIRLSLSTCYFPIAWPAPAPVRMTVKPAGSALMLPVRGGEEQPVRDLGTPRAGPPLPVTFEAPPRSEWQVREDQDTGRITVEVSDHEGAAHIDEHGIFHSSEGREAYSALPYIPTSASGEVTWTHEMRRDGWAVKTVTDTTLTSDADNFHIEARLRAWHMETLVRDLNWEVSIPRKLV